MKLSKKLLFSEKLSRIAVDASIIDDQRKDRRSGMQSGSIRQACSQYGVRLKIDGDTAILSAPRDRLQPIAESLHYCRIKFLIL